MLIQGHATRKYVRDPEIGSADWVDIEFGPDDGIEIGYQEFVKLFGIRLRKGQKIAFSVNARKIQGFRRRK